MAQPVVVDEGRVRAAVLPSLAVGARVTGGPVTARGLVAGFRARFAVPETAGTAVRRPLVLHELRERAPVGRKPLFPVVVWAVLREGFFLLSEREWGGGESLGEMS